MFDGLEGVYGRRCGAAGVLSSAGICAAVDQREESEMSIGQPARIIGRSPASSICGAVVRDGVTLYALVGVPGVWPSWVVEAA